MTTVRIPWRLWLLLGFASACTGSKPEATKPTVAVPPASAESPAPPGPSPAPSQAPPAASTSLPEATGETLFVDAQRVTCQGEGPMQCLRVRRSEAESWELFYESIEGFEFEAGHRYELRVEVSPVQSPPADGTSLRYRLIELVSKQAAGAAD